ncbi:MAG: recombinase family protein [Thermoplasmatales archaeon]|nr:recombinase family protein [Thermoplasmatales archaeon]
MQFHIISAFAEFERELISARTKEGMKRTKKKIGRPKGSKDKKRRKKGGYYLRYKKT